MDDDSNVKIEAGGKPVDAEMADQHAMCKCCRLPITDNESAEFCTPCRKGETRAAEDVPVGAPKYVEHHWTGCKMISRKYRRFLWKRIRMEERAGKRVQ